MWLLVQNVSKALLVDIILVLAERPKSCGFLYYLVHVHVESVVRCLAFAHFE